jgi:hypothetical protein
MLKGSFKMITLSLLGIIVIAIVAILTIIDNRKKNRIELIHNKNSSAKKLDRVGYVFNIVLSIIYIPISWISWLFMMASEATIDATNQTFIFLINVFCWITMIIPFLCFLGIFLSVRYRKKGYSVRSFVVQFLPLIIFGLNLLLLFIAERLPAKI